MQIKEKFFTFSKFLACPYVLNLDAIKPYVYNVSILLVGSAATELCNSASTVDICILCNREIYEKIDPLIERNNGKYTEMTISGVKTRYYLEKTEDVVEGLLKLDDLTHYLYASAIPLDDVSGAYKAIQKYIADNDLIAKRKKHVFRSMMRRRRAISSFLDNCKDPFGRLSATQDTLKGVLRALAVYDNIPFDPQKNTYQTAVSGETGKILTPCIDEIMLYTMRIFRPEDVQAQKEFLKLIDNCISAIS